jgi:hypothetical protein
MHDFKLDKSVLFTIDLKGIAVVNKEKSTKLIIKYPEAAVWLVLIEKHSVEKAKQMLRAILSKSEFETGKYIRHCIKHWKQLGLIQ